ncbi:MAG: hypothetical protein GX592_10890 [Clostridiales bacterium]|nr:hypothetical protein [Clostridiales bacterium]
MSIRAKISLNIESFKQTLRELPGKTKQAFVSMGSDVKGFFRAFRQEINGTKLSLSSLAKAQFFGGGALGIISAGFRSVVKLIGDTIADGLQRGADRMKQIAANVQQYGDLRAAQKSRSNADLEALRTLEAQQLKRGDLSQEDIARRDIAVRTLSKSFPQFAGKIQYDDTGRVRNFTDLQSSVIEADTRSELHYVQQQIRDQQSLIAEIDAFQAKYDLNTAAGAARFAKDNALSWGRLQEQLDASIAQRADAVKKLNALRDDERSLERSTAAEDADALFRAKRRDFEAAQAGKDTAARAQTRYTEAQTTYAIRADRLTARGGMLGGAVVTQEITWRQGVASDLKTLNNTIGSISGSVRTIEQETRL